MSFLPFCEWLASTAGSIALHESLYMYPLVESIHVWALTLFLGMVTMLDLRLVGLTLRQVPVTEIVTRLRPWMMAGFAVMIVSGTILFYAIPVRTYQSLWFRSKMILLLGAGLNAGLFHSGVYRTVAAWDLAGRIPRAAKLAGAASIVLWACIVFSGRFIAYNWFDCDRQPQPQIINLLAGCVLEPASPEQEQALAR
jgi:hypothetical protein